MKNCMKQIVFAAALGAAAALASCVGRQVVVEAEAEGLGAHAAAVRVRLKKERP